MVRDVFVRFKHNELLLWKYIHDIFFHLSYFYILRLYSLSIWKMRFKITLQCIIATRKSFLLLSNAFITFLKYSTANVQMLLTLRCKKVKHIKCICHKRWKPDPTTNDLLNNLCKRHFLGNVNSFVYSDLQRLFQDLYVI